MSRTTFGAFLALALTTAAMAPTTHAAAQTLSSEQALRRTIYVPRDKSLSFRLPSPASRIVIAQPEVAKVTATSDSTFYVQGIEFGSTNMLIYGRGGQLQQVIDVRVGYDADGLQQDLAAAYPNERIQVRSLGETLMLTGQVSTSNVAVNAQKIAEKYAPDAVISRLNVGNSDQVILEVRVLEASRTALRDFGIDLNIVDNSFAFASGSGLVGASNPMAQLLTHGHIGDTSIDTAISALEEKGVVRTLAKPNLVAMSGQKASFLAGGEFPFPVPQGQNTVSVEFRPYGVKLNFMPIVQENGWIRLNVEPEVSAIDPTNSLTIQGLNVPALVVRRASTTLELKPGDTFAMAGLFQRDYQNTAQQAPWIGDIPVLGALFRSARWKRSESELLIIVRPRLATAADHAVEPLDAMPGKEPSEADIFLRGKVLDKPLPVVTTPKTAKATAADTTTAANTTTSAEKK